MSTELQIANRALRHLGIPPIVSVAANAGSFARVLNDALPDSINEVLSLHEWSANRITVSSTGTSFEELDTPHAFRHDLSVLDPTFDNVTKITDERGNRISDYRIEHNNLDICAETVILSYTYQVSDVSSFPQYLVSVIAAHLAKETCLSLTGDQNKGYVMEKKFQSVFRDARSQEFKQNPHNSKYDNGTVSGYIAAHQGYPAPYREVSVDPSPY